MHDAAPENPYEANEIWLDSERITEAEGLPRGVTVTFKPTSVGNVVQLSSAGRYQNVQIDLGSAANCVVSLGSIRVAFGGLKISFVLNNGRVSSGAAVSVGDGTVFNGATHIIGALSDGVAVTIGRDCLFASNVSVRGSSHHGLWDMDSGELLNPEVGITVGDHVWVGNQVILLNKAEIGSGSVVAARSIVNKRFVEQNALLAGTPAAIRRSRVEWTNGFPKDNGAQPRNVPNR
ncbi:acyltransferase [Microbacterium gorillae]|uniref:acyltransferase n=1 Tax=Microbacterium gorillae TaxID=1231063 RepID=UPI003D978792